MDEIELENNPAKHFRDIGTAVEFVRKTVKNFDDIPERVVPSFPITEDEINYLEGRVRKSIRLIDEKSGVDMGEGYEAFFEDSVRFGLNYMLKNEDDPQMKYYLEEYKIEKQREDFLHDLVNLCYMHGLSLAHEDIEGGFLIHQYNDKDVNWLLNAK